MVKRIARIAGSCAFLVSVMPATLVGATQSDGSSFAGITAARSGRPTVLAAPSRRSAESSVSPGLTKSEGTGKAFCAGTGGYPLGANYDNVYACGPAWGVGDDFDSGGFQCVELSIRFLWVTRGDFVSNVPAGKDMVDYAHNQLGIPMATPGVGRLPAPGDVVSMWGDANAQAYGHTAIVTAVQVDSNGNGTITTMEENGLADGWDQINVSGWSESYGDPNWDGGYYYYNHVEWLQLQPPGDPPPSVTSYTVQGLGPNTVAAGVNDSGAVAGVSVQTQGNQSTSQPFLFTHEAGIGALQRPGSPSPHTTVTGINNNGAVAAWGEGTSSQPLGYTLHTANRFQWSRLPSYGTSAAATHTTSIDPAGDVTGWQSSGNTNGWALGLVWFHRRNGYGIRALYANRYFSNPVVTATDHWGDAVGTETLGTTKTFAVIWASWGKAYRLPALSSASTYSNAAAMWVDKTGPTSLTLTIVGSSENAAGVRHACEWIVRSTPGYLDWNKPVDLTSSDFSGPSTAVAVSSSGGVVGELLKDSGSEGAFLWQPSVGMVNLQSLLPSSSYWKINSVAGINAQNEIVGQGQPGHGGGMERGVLLTPHSAPAS